MRWTRFAWFMAVAIAVGGCESGRYLRIDMPRAAPEHRAAQSAALHECFELVAAEMGMKLERTWFWKPAGPDERYGRSASYSGERTGFAMYLLVDDGRATVSFRQGHPRFDFTVAEEASMLLRRRLEERGWHWERDLEHRGRVYWETDDSDG